MRTNHLFVFIHFRNKGEAGTIKLVYTPSKNILLTVPRRCFFSRSFLLHVFMFRVCHAVISVPCSLVVICWERANFLAFLYVMFSCVCFLSSFPCGVLGQVWYFIVSIPDLCLLPYFKSSSHTGMRRSVFLINDLLQ